MSRRAFGLLCGLLGGLLCACESLEYAALDLFLAVNPHLDVGDGATEWQARSESLRLVPVVDGLDYPWDIVFIDETSALISEKTGHLLRIDLGTGERYEIAGVPEVAFVGQGGLLGVELHPDFATNQLLYLAYSIAGEDRHFTTRFARARLAGNALEDLEILLTAEPWIRAVNHFGGALEFGADGMLYASVGDRKSRHEAQKLSAHLGKILRLRPDGTAPDDNPFASDPSAKPEIYSLGHRNPQGLARHPRTGEIWEAEHGPRGGDEINIVRPGRNYGWPIISHGEEYAGGQVGIGTHREGLEQPVHYYVPSIATSGIGFYEGDDLASWKGNLFVGGLIGTQVSRIALDGERVREVEPLFVDLWMRVRAIAQSPDRKLYVLTENGKLFRIEPHT